LSYSINIANICIRDTNKSNNKLYIKAYYILYIKAYYILYIKAYYILRYTIYIYI
jgi:hypothetical protein